LVAYVKKKVRVQKKLKIQKIVKDKRRSGPEISRLMERTKRRVRILDGDGKGDCDVLVILRHSFDICVFLGARSCGGLVYSC
jgi:hypothetical protein